MRFKLSHFNKSTQRRVQPGNPKTCAVIPYSSILRVLKARDHASTFFLVHFIETMITRGSILSELCETCLAVSSSIEPHEAQKPSIILRLCPHCLFSISVHIVRFYIFALRTTHHQNFSESLSFGPCRIILIRTLASWTPLESCDRAASFGAPWLTLFSKRRA